MITESVIAPVRVVWPEGLEADSAARPIGRRSSWRRPLDRPRQPLARRWCSTSGSSCYGGIRLTAVEVLRGAACSLRVRLGESVTEAMVGTLRRPEASGRGWVAARPRRDRVPVRPDRPRRPGGSACGSRCPRRIIASLTIPRLGSFTSRPTPGSTRSGRSAPGRRTSACRTTSGTGSSGAGPSGPATCTPPPP